MYVWDGSKIFLLGRIPFSMHSGGGSGSISICFGGKEPGEVLSNGGYAFEWVMDLSNHNVGMGQ